MKVKDICTLQNGRAFKPDDWGTEGLPIVRIQNLNDENAPFNYFSGEYSSVHEINDGELLFSWSGTPGTSFGAFRWFRGKGVLNQHIFKVIPKIQVDKEYLRYALNGNLQTIIERAHGGVGLQHITKKELDEIDIPIVNEAQQCTIVEILSRIERIISERKKQLTELDNLIKARFVEMFGDCKNEALIGDVISISRGASPRPISAFITDRDDGVNWIKIGDVSENSLYITKTEEKITPEGAKKSRMVHKGDFILSNSMSFGRPYILGINGCVHDGWLIMSDFKETFNELYLYHAIRSDDVQYQFSGKVNGATVKNLNSDLVKNTFIKVPSMELQNQFAAFVEQTDKSKVVVQKALDEAQLLFDSLMQKYFG